MHLLDFNYKTKHCSAIPLLDIKYKTKARKHVGARNAASTPVKLADKLQRLCYTGVFRLIGSSQEQGAMGVRRRSASVCYDFEDGVRHHRHKHFEEADAIIR